MTRHSAVSRTMLAALAAVNLNNTEGGGNVVIAEDLRQQVPTQSEWECGVVENWSRAGEGITAAGCRPTGWSDGVIPFEFAIAGLNPGYVLAAMDIWGQADAGIVFVPRTNETDFVRFVSDDTFFGGRSFVGMIGGSQDFSVHPTLWAVQPLLLHEMGHLLGYGHEHQRTDRDSFVRINQGNIDSGAGSDIVPIIPASCWLTLATNYDFLSILHYRTCQRSACDPCPVNPTCADGGQTIVPLAGFEAFVPLTGNVLLPSATDIQDMRNIYGRGKAVYVDRFAAPFIGNGTLLLPFDTLVLGVGAITPGSTLAVREGTYTSPQVIDKSMKIRSYLGSVTLTR